MFTRWLGEVIEIAVDIEREFGRGTGRAVMLGTDNQANALMGSGRSQPARLGHAARRYVVFLQRVRAGRITLKKIPDKEMPADFLTKLGLPKDKVRLSTAYATNPRNAVQAAAAAKPLVSAAAEH